MIDTLDIEPHLKARLAVLAEREGRSFEEFAEQILRNQADMIEREILEEAEDERRWQKYLETGASIPFDQVRSKIRTLAASAGEIERSK